MNKAQLAAAIRAHAQALTDKANDRPEGWAEHDRDTIELVTMAARWVEGVPMAKAFGPPGDWGYSHPIGKAIYARETDEQPQDLTRCLLTDALTHYDNQDLDKVLFSLESVVRRIGNAVDEVASEPPPTAATFPNCTHVLMKAGKAYPRTCAECGLGPCKIPSRPRAAPDYTAEVAVCGTCHYAKDVCQCVRTCDHDWKPTGKGTEEKCTKCGATCPF